MVVVSDGGGSCGSIIVVATVVVALGCYKGLIMVGEGAV